jgi:Tfp pilus assembly protein PilF
MSRPRKHASAPTTNVKLIILLLIGVTGFLIWFAVSRKQMLGADAARKVLTTNEPSAITLKEPESEPAEIDVDKAVDALTKGNELLAQGKLNEAIEQYSLAVKFNPEDEDTHYNLAFGLARLGKLEAAKKSYVEALRIYPDYVEARNNLGNLLVKEGRFAEAVEQFREAIKNDPDKASLQNNLGNALARQGKVAEAIPFFHLAIQLEPNYTEARFNLANSYLSLKRYDEAIAELNAILQREPNFRLAAVALEKAQRQKAAGR